MKNELVVISNRELYSRKKGARVKSAGGVAPSIDSVLRTIGGKWIVRSETAPPREYVVQTLPKYTVHAFLLSEEETHYYYHGFSNKVLWPLSHDFIERCEFSNKAFNWYAEVNQKFAARACKIISNSNIVWVHDFHLCLVPMYIRKQGLAPVIAFSWHAPFPSPEIYRILPQREELLKGLLQSDIVCFHCAGYVKNFLDSCKVILGAEVNQKRNTGNVRYEGRTTEVKAIPIGIDYKTFNNLSKDKAIIERAKKIRERFAVENIILGVERLDYTKGTLHRLQAYEHFLDKYPEVRKKVMLIQIVPPSRMKVEAYRRIRGEIDKMVGKICGRFATPEWVPIVYLAQTLSTKTLATYYLLSDIALITPLIDGWNLVAEEYVATKNGKPGVLILSELTGCSELLKEAFIVNPYNISEVADTLLKAISLPKKGKVAMMNTLQSHIEKHDLKNWHTSILKESRKLPL